MFHRNTQMFHGTLEHSMEAVKCYTEPLTTRVRLGLDLSMDYFGSQRPDMMGSGVEDISEGAAMTALAGNTFVCLAWHNGDTGVHKGGVEALLLGTGAAGCRR